MVDRVQRHREKTPLMEAFGAEEQIRSTLSRRVDLPSGGYLVFDYAEAFTVIDVNTGRFVGSRGKSSGGRLEDTITKNNLEAVKEVVRQLRLRDIGGIIVIDFIDMSRARNRDAVLKTLRKALDEDRTKTYVVEISPLGLVEMTRQNVTEGVREIMTRTCPTCNGEGVILSEETVAINVERKLRDLVAEKPEPEAYLIQAHPAVARLLLDGPGRPLLALEEEVGKRFFFEGTEALPLDYFAVAMEGSREEVEQRALPFQPGEELLVKIEEPHMYNEDDAVAKIDGYVISVAAAGRFIGDRKLVRIEKVGRTSADAVVVGDAGDADEAQKADEAAQDDNGKRPRRRGRRGGRGRKKAASEASDG
jgi:ribonuclease G